MSKRDAALFEGQSASVRSSVVSAIRGLQVILVSAVLLQRIGIPVGNSYVSPVLLIAIAVTIYMRTRGYLTEKPALTTLLLIAMGLCLAATLINAALWGLSSLFSLALLIVGYAAFVWRIPDLDRHESRFALTQLATLFVRLMIVVALIAIAQMVAQLLGLWTFTDSMPQVVPMSWLVQGYQTANLVTYGSDLYRSNGIIMLEASFCSQFLALAVVALPTSSLRHKRWLTCLLLLAILCTVSGTGLILLGAGFVGRAWTRGAAFAIKGLLAVGLVILALLLTPLSAVYGSRAGEFGSTTSSGNQRFIAPYVDLATQMASNPRTLLIGQGPGFSDRYAIEVSELTGAPRIAPPLVKLLQEYGLIAGSIFALTLGFAFSRGSPSRHVSLGVLTFFFLLSGSLLQMQTLYVAWSLTSPISASRQRARNERVLDGPSLSGCRSGGQPD